MSPDIPPSTGRSDVARAARVPLALVELIHEHLDPQPLGNPTAGDRTRPDLPPAAHAVPIPDQAAGAAAREATETSAGSGATPRTDALLGRRFRWTARAVCVTFLLNAVLAVTAAATRDHALAEASLIAGPVTAAIGLGLLWVQHARTAARFGQPDPRQP